MSFDDLFKQSFKYQYGNAVKSEIAVGALEKSFDLWLLGNQPEIQDSEILPALFKQYEDNIIEFKSGHDRYQLYDILKLQGDFCYFSYNRKLSLDEAYNNSCLCFLIVNPQPFKRQFKQNGIEKDEEPGYYHLRKSFPEVRIIIINELDSRKKENELLLLHSSGEKFRSFLRNLMEKDELIDSIQNYLSLKFIIESKELATVVEVQQIKTQFSFEENIRFGIEQLGIGKVIAAVGLDKVIAEVGLDKVIAEVGAEKVLATLGAEKIIENFDMAELEAAIEKKKKNL